MPWDIPPPPLKMTTLYLLGLIILINNYGALARSAGASKAGNDHEMVWTGQTIPHGNYYYEPTYYTNELVVQARLAKLAKAKAVAAALMKAKLARLAKARAHAKLIRSRLAEARARKIRFSIALKFKRSVAEAMHIKHALHIAIRRARALRQLLAKALAMVRMLKLAIVKGRARGRIIMTKLVRDRAKCIIVARARQRAIARSQLIANIKHKRIMAAMARARAIEISQERRIISVTTIKIGRSSSRIRALQRALAREAAIHRKLTYHLYRMRNKARLSRHRYAVAKVKRIRLAKARAIAFARMRALARAKARKILLAIDRAIAIAKMKILARYKAGKIRLAKAQAYVRGLMQRLTHVIRQVKSRAVRLSHAKSKVIALRHTLIRATTLTLTATKYRKWSELTVARMNAIIRKLGGFIVTARRYRYASPLYVGIGAARIPLAKELVTYTGIKQILSKAIGIGRKYTHGFKYKGSIYLEAIKKSLAVLTGRARKLRLAIKSGGSGRLRNVILPRELATVTELRRLLAQAMGPGKTYRYGGYPYRGYGGYGGYGPNKYIRAMKLRLAQANAYVKRVKYAIYKYGGRGARARHLRRYVLPRAMAQVRAVRLRLARATRGGKYRYGYGYGSGYKYNRVHRYRGMRQKLRRAMISYRRIRHSIAKYGGSSKLKIQASKVLATIRALRSQIAKYRNAGEPRRGSKYRYRYRRPGRGYRYKPRRRFRYKKRKYNRNRGEPGFKRKLKKMIKKMTKKIMKKKTKKPKKH